MVPQIPHFAWLVIFAAGMSLVFFVGAAARAASSPRSLGAAFLVSAVAGAWLSLVVALSGAGFFRGNPKSPPPIGAAIALPIAAGLLALGISGRLRSFVGRIPRTWLVGIQSQRVLGVVFLVLMARGILPAHFALAAGLGDILVGALAPFVAYALVRNVRYARPAAIAWNLLGILDLVTALSLGALSATSAIRLFHSTPSTDAMGSLPLALIPAFAVPVFLLLHVVSLWGLRRSVAGVPGARGTVGRFQSAMAR
jgi:hypothetical protein